MKNIFINLIKECKIVQIALLLSLFPVNELLANDAATTQLFSVQKREATIKQVFEQIEKNSQFVIFYNSDLIDVNKKITIDVKNKTVKQLLDQLFKNTALTYRIVDKQITIVKAEQQKPQDTKNGYKVSGTIKDKKGEILIGVNVVVKSTTIGTISDINGRFELRVPNANALLEISYIGFYPQSFLIKESKELNVVLKENTQILDEVVVVGYGKQSKVSVTGSVASVSAMELKQSPVSNLSSALAGRLPGLLASQSSGEPGGDASTIWIRGLGTYSEAALKPLILVDGIERTFDDIDANEIENISILKDASSTAVYGVQGANGVVLVTTKRGMVDKPRITASYQHSIQTPTRLPDYLDSYDALSLYREGLLNDGRDGEASLYTEEYLNKYRDRSNPTYQYLYPNVNWMDECLKETSQMMKANINVSGGSAMARYFVSVGYMNQDGMYKHADKIKDYDIQARTERYNFRSNVDLDLTRDLSMEVNLGGIFKNRNFPGTSADSFFKGLKMAPTSDYPMVNPDGSIGAIPNRTSNPYGQLTQTGYKRYFESTLQATAGFKLEMPWITKGLSARARVSFDASNYRNVERTKSPYTYQFLIDEAEIDLSKGTYQEVDKGSTNLNYTVSANGSRNFLLEAFINYNRTFADKHDVGGMFLYTQGERFRDVGNNQAILGLPYRRQGFVGKFNYSYAHRYYIEGNFGLNGSENFPKGKRFGFFPSVSMSWVASNEDFIKNNFPSISILKFRSSYGSVGNDYIGGSEQDRFLYISSWANAGSYRFDADYGGGNLPGIQEATTGNPNVTWETAKKFNFGLDLGLWDNQLRVTADVFYEKRKNILTTSGKTPLFSGIIKMPRINAGIVENKGFEVEIEHHKKINNHSYFVKGNFSFARNKIVEIDEPTKPGLEYQQKTGTRVGEQYGLVALGLFGSWDEINDPNTPKQTFGPVQPGDIKYKDMNGDGKINNQDETYLGRVYRPEAMYGFSVGYTYKNFDVSLLFQGAIGGNTWFTGPTVFPFQNKSASVLKDVKDNHFTEANPDPNSEWPRLSATDNSNNYKNSTFWLRKKDYLRLKNVEIGYNLPKSLISKARISSMRIYLTGLNLLTWDNLKIADPESSGGTGYYPQQSVYNIGVNVTF